MDNRKLRYAKKVISLIITGGGAIKTKPNNL